MEYRGRYFAIGSVAAVVNISALSLGFYFMYKLAKQKGITDEINDALRENDSLKTKILTYKKYFMILLPVLLQVMDSLLDALYFIKLKTGYRIIQVPAYVQVMQGLLLFTCKCSVREQIFLTN